MSGLDDLEAASRAHVPVCPFHKVPLDFDGCPVAQGRVVAERKVEPVIAPHQRARKSRGAKPR